MLRKLTFAGMVAVLAVFASLLGGPTNPAFADPAPAQRFNIDAIGCRGGTAPDPIGGIPLVCSGEDKTVSGTPDSISVTTIPSGNRNSTGYSYSGPGWPTNVDAEFGAGTCSDDVDNDRDGLEDEDDTDCQDPIPVPDRQEGTQLGEVVVWLDLQCDGDTDVLADGGVAPPNQNPTRYYERTTNWGPGTGPFGSDETYLDLLVPPDTVMDPTIRVRGDLSWAWVDLAGGAGAFWGLDLFRNVVPVNSITMHPAWSPAGTRAGLVISVAAPNSPSTTLACTDTLFGSLSVSDGTLTGGNPSAAGLYVAWGTQISAKDHFDGARNFVYTTSCKAIGGTFTDSDSDCLADAATTPVGQWLDPDDDLPDVDGDLLLDGVEVAWGSSPPFEKTAITVTANVPAQTINTQLTVSTTAGLTVDDRIDLVQYDTSLSKWKWESMKVESIDSGTLVTVSRAYVSYVSPGPSTGDGTQGSATALAFNTADGTIYVALQPGIAVQRQAAPIYTAYAGESADMDQDGRTDLEEMIGPSQFLTDPTNWDTDGDGVLDGGLLVDLGVDGVPDVKDYNGDGTPDSGINVEGTDADGSSHTRVGAEIVGTDLGPDNAAPNTYRDNCPSIANGLSEDDQANFDLDSLTEHGNGDLFGDACDDDKDQDFFLDLAESTFEWDPVGGGCDNDNDVFDSGTGFYAGLSSADPDADDDGVLDGRECEFGSNPADATSTPAKARKTYSYELDADKDGLLEGIGLVDRTEEKVLRTKDISGANPVDPEAVPDGLTGDADNDSDGDGLPDGCEALITGTSPINTDTDGDGALTNDYAEYLVHFPADPCNVVLSDPEDLDGDTVLNDVDTCLYEPNAGAGQTTDSDLLIGNGIGLAGDDTTSPFGGSTPDACDGDWDNDGVQNGLEATSVCGGPNDDGSGGVDITYDDNLDGTMLNLGDTGPSWDDDGDAVINSMEATCYGSETVLVDRYLNTDGLDDDDADKVLNVVLNLDGGGTHQVDISHALVDVDESGVVDTADDLNDVELDLLAGGTHQVDIIDGRVDVDESGGVDGDDDLDDVVLNVLGGATDQVDIIDGQVDVNESGVINDAVDDTDDDDDGLLDAWEVYKWGTNPITWISITSRADSDGDGANDCNEAADVNGDGAVNFVGDVIAYARAALLPDASYGQDGDFDINGDGTVNFVGDVIQEAKFGLIPGLCK